MCGICGAIDLTGRQTIALDRIRAMTEAIRHRGPDGDGFYVEGPVGLGMRRLSIIDIEGGDQPIPNEDGSVQLLFNGEIYNYVELREDLLKQGHQLATRSDTETIVHLYESYGLDLFSHLRGMYAFALWDKSRHRLVLAIDHIGIKPLYVYQAGDLLVFGSEVKALLAYGPEVPRQFNEAALDTYMTFGFQVGPETLFKGIRRVEPGTALVIENGTVREIRHWALTYPEPGSQPAGAEKRYVEAVRQTFEEAVRIHLRSDVPLGLFLSGGLDSASLLAMMSRFEPGRIKTFSVGYDISSHLDDELQAARETAQVFNSDHHELILTSGDWWDAMCHYVYAHDEPNANPSAVSLLALSKLTAQSVKVVLNGIGSDELFGGYASHRSLPGALRQAETLQRFLPAAIRRGLRSALDRFEGLYPTFSRIRGLGALPYILPPRYYALDDLENHVRRALSFDGIPYSTATRRALFKNGSDEGSRSAFHRLFASAPTHQPDNLVHYLNIYRWLPGNGLLSADKVSMAYSLEGRVPYFDRSLMELAVTIPPAIRSRENKYLLRAAMQGTLPEVIRTRAKKPFGTPIQAWFGGVLQPRMKEVLYDRDALTRPYFNQAPYSRLLDNHFAGRTSQPELIWRLLNLELWQRAFLNASQSGA